MGNLDISPAKSKGIFVDDTQGIVRVTGMALLPNGDFRIVRTWTHPNPPPVSERRCRTVNGKLPETAPEPLPDAEKAADIAVQDAGRIDAPLDPPWCFNDDPLDNPELYIWTYHEDGLTCERRPRDEEDEFFDEEGAL